MAAGARGRPDRYRATATDWSQRRGEEGAAHLGDAAREEHGSGTNNLAGCRGRRAWRPWCARGGRCLGRRTRGRRSAASQHAPVVKEVEEEEAKLIDTEAGLEDDVDEGSVSEKIGGHRKKASLSPTRCGSSWSLAWRRRWRTAAHTFWTWALST